MADPEHLAIVKKGAKAIEEWRLNNKNVSLELAFADLRGADLRGANLEDAVLFTTYLYHADLSDAKLSGAHLEKANLFGADLSFANLSKAMLVGVELAFSNLLVTNFSETNLSKAKLGFAHIKHSIFSNTDLSESVLIGATLCNPTVNIKPVNLKNATMEYTVLSDCNMNDFTNLNTVKHKGPSYVDIDTLTKSYSKSDEFERNLEPFFLQAGVPKNFLDSLPEIVAGIAYCSCFVCYGEPDKPFAEKLVKDLKAEGISCWIYSMDATPGKKIWKEITQKRREADRMIVLCSVKSLIRDGVKKEIEEQLDEEPEKMIPISLDNLWKEEGFLVKRGQRDLKGDLIDCTYADFSDHSKYAKSFRRLLKALKKPKK